MYLGHFSIDFKTDQFQNAHQEKMVNFYFNELSGFPELHRLVNHGLFLASEVRAVLQVHRFLVIKVIERRLVRNNATNEHVFCLNTKFP